MDFDNPKVYGDTSITDGLVIFCNIEMIMLKGKLGGSEDRAANWWNSEEE